MEAAGSEAPGTSQRPWWLRGIVFGAVLLAVPVEWRAAFEVTTGALLVVPLLVLALVDAGRWAFTAVLLAVVGRLICIAGGHAGVWEGAVDCFAYVLAGRVGYTLRSHRGDLLSTKVEPGRSEVAVNPWDALTRREREVVDLVLEGFTSKQVGRRLFISERTVERHLEKAYSKLAVHGRGDLKKSFRSVLGSASE
jgi:DNA-binding CsgD family transcriptional regulator